MLNLLGCPVCSSGQPRTLQWWKSWGLASSVALGRAVTAGSAHPGLTPHGRAGCIRNFSHILIRLMEWPEMLMGLELSRMTMRSGFALAPIPAAHQRGTAAPDLRAIRAPYWGGTFPPRCGSSPDTSQHIPQSAARSWSDFFVDCAQHLVHGLMRWDIMAGDLEALRGRRAFGPPSDEATCWATALQTPRFSPLPNEVIALQAGRLRGDYGLGSIAGVNHLVLTGSSGARWICTSCDFIHCA